MIIENRPASAMAGLGFRWTREGNVDVSNEEGAGESGKCPHAQHKQEQQSWFAKTIGRTPSLPASLGKKKTSFLKVRNEVF